LNRFTDAIFAILNQNEKRKLAILIVYDLLISVLDIAFLGFMLILVNYYTKGNAKADFLFNYFTYIPSLWIILGFSFLFSVKNWIAYRLSASQNHFFFKVASRLSKRNIEQYLRNEYASFVNIDSSVQIRKIGQQPIEFSTYILVNIQQILSQSMLVVFAIVAILIYHTSLFLLLLILLLPPIVILSYLVKRQLKNIRANMKRVSEKTIQYLKESLAGFVENKLFNKQDFFVRRYYGFQQKLNESIATQRSLQGLPSRMVEVFAILGFFMLLFIHQFWTGLLNVELFDIGVFLTAAYKIIPGIVKILNSIGQINSYTFILRDLKVKSEIKVQNTQVSEQIDFIQFKAVSFSYPEIPVLNNFDFELNQGDFIGMYGKSGRGKTTIINLLLGFIVQESGAIEFNYRETSQLNRQHYWNRISYVKQQPFLINDSILKNITLSDTTYDTARLEEAMDFCDLKQLIAQYPNGLDHLITEDGKNISGGQRQRIVLARAIYHDFDLLILDEPFSELDEASERKMLSKLAGLAKDGKIVLMITHNKIGLTFCNKIISLDEE
jgi:ABC-type multidrug transport system fused ATPase/permease subunit